MTDPIEEFWRRRLQGSQETAESFAGQHGGLESSDLEELRLVETVTGQLEERARRVREIASSERCALVRYLGSGGMGEVWLIQDVDGRLRALKTLKSGLSDYQTRALKSEVEAASRLDHPWIVEISAFRSEPEPHVLMEFVEGVAATDAVPHGADRDEIAAYLVAKACDAIAFAHARHVVHGDLKPSNILVDEYLNPHLLDFGLSRLGGSQDPVVGGTRGYSPPEIGRAHEPGPWTDTYSLCALLREMLTGTPGGDLSTVDSRLRRILTKGLEDNPRRRYQSAEKLAHDLRRWLWVPWLHPRITVRSSLVALIVVLAAAAGWVLAQPEAVTGIDPRVAWRLVLDDEATAKRILEEGLASEDPDVVVRATCAATCLFRGEFTQQFWDLAQPDRDFERVRTWALWAFARGGSVPVHSVSRAQLRESLARHLESDNHTVRCAAALALRVHGLDTSGLQKLREWQGPAYFAALTASSSPEDWEYVYNHASKDPRQPTNALLLRWRPSVFGERIFQGLATRMGRLLSAKRGFEVPDWLGDPWIRAPKDQNVRQQLLRWLSMVHKHHVANPSTPIARRMQYKAMRALGGLACVGDSIEGRPCVAWLTSVCSSRMHPDVKLAAAEAIARINRAESRAWPSAIQEILEAPPFDKGQWKAWSLMHQARMHAWVGDASEARDKMIMATAHGFCNRSFITQHPLAGVPGLFADCDRRTRQEPLTRMHPGKATRDLSDSEWRRVHEAIEKGGLTSRSKANHWFMLKSGDAPVVKGWDATLTAIDTDPFDERQEFILATPYRSAITLEFTLASTPKRASFLIWARAFLNSTVPGRGHAELQITVNSRAVRPMEKLIPDHQRPMAYGLIPFLKKGKNSITILLGPAVTVAGIHTVTLDVDAPAVRRNR